MNSFFFMWYKFSKNLVNQKFECSTNIKFSTGMYGDISCYKPKNQISTETTFILNPQKLVSMEIKESTVFWSKNNKLLYVYVSVYFCVLCIFNLYHVDLIPFQSIFGENINEPPVHQPIKFCAELKLWPTYGTLNCCLFLALEDPLFICKLFTSFYEYFVVKK